MTDHIHWIEKYRPKELDDIVSQGHIVSTLTKLMSEKKLPHLMFYGPPGTGKTSTILACARKMYGSGYQQMVLELNASDDRGIDVVREQIKDFASTRKIFSSGIKLVILDEADNMDNTAQAALRRVIEKYTKNTRFCLICNYVNKIIPALQSRCMRFRFSPLKREQIVDRLGFVATSEGCKMSPDGLEALVKLGQGDMRKCINIMQATAMAYDGVISAENVYTCTGNPRPEDIHNILTWLLNEDIKNAYQKIAVLKEERGVALSDILTDVHKLALRVEMPASTLIDIIVRLSEIEQRLATGANETVQLGALCSTFQLARTEIVSAMEVVS